MSLIPRKHDKLNNPKYAALSLDSFLGLLSSAYGTEELDSSILFDKDKVNWTNISVENLRAIPKKEDIGDKVKKEKVKETCKLNAATSTTNLRPKKPDDSEEDGTLFSIRSLISLQQIKSNLDSSVKDELNSSQHDNSKLRENIIDTPSADLGEQPENRMQDPNTTGESIEIQCNEVTPVCGFYVDDFDHKVVFDIQFVKKVTLQNEIMPVFNVGEPEILININDTLKPMNASVKVAKCNLVSKVRYFAEVEKEFGLENLDVIVKCNFGVFQWVLQWIMSDIPMCKPNLNCINLKLILSMANHLGIKELVQECLDFFRKNFNLVLDSDREIEDVFDDDLMLDLSKRFSNSEVENINNDYKSFKTKLFCSLIKLLADPEPCQQVGHFSGLSTIFQCGFCEKIMHIGLADAVPCRTDCTQLTSDGRVEFHHECSSFWSLSKYIEAIHEELKEWRLVYWQLWGMCHFFYCEVCHTWYPMSQSDWCPYHPGEVEYFPIKNNLFYPIGTYGCCGEKTFKFEVVKPNTGCRYKSHVSKLDTMEKVEIYNIHQEFKQLIEVPHPKDITIKKFVKLVKKSDECSILQIEPQNESFWWESMLLAPEEKKDYSLIPLQVLNSLRNRPVGKRHSKMHVPLKYGTQVPFGSILSSETNILQTDSREESPSATRHIQVSKKSRPKLTVKKGKSSNINLGSRTKTKKKKSLSYVYQPTESVWTDLESNKDNQDNQRDFEEIAMRKLVQMLTPTDIIGSSQGSSAGSYIRLETEWWQRNCGSNMDKTSSTVVNRTFPLSWFRRLTI